MTYNQLLALKKGDKVRVLNGPPGLVRIYNGLSNVSYTIPDKDKIRRQFPARLVGGGQYFAAVLERVE